jgi:hypothetical protein
VTVSIYFCDVRRTRSSTLHCFNRREIRRLCLNWQESIRISLMVVLCVVPHPFQKKTLLLLLKFNKNILITFKKINVVILDNWMHVDNRELFLTTLLILYHKNTKNCSKRITDLKTIAKSMSITTAGFILSPLSPQPPIHQSTKHTHTHTHIHCCMVEVISAPHVVLQLQLHRATSHLLVFWKYQLSCLKSFFLYFIHSEEMSISQATACPLM